MKLQHEESFCPVSCPIGQLEVEIYAARENNLFGNEEAKRVGFLEGVLHARILIAAAINRKIAA